MAVAARAGSAPAPPRQATLANASIAAAPLFFVALLTMQDWGRTRGSEKTGLRRQAAPGPFGSTAPAEILICGSDDVLEPGNSSRESISTENTQNTSTSRRAVCLGGRVQHLPPPPPQRRGSRGCWRFETTLFFFQRPPSQPHGNLFFLVFLGFWLFC